MANEKSIGQIIVVSAMRKFATIIVCKLLHAMISYVSGKPQLWIVNGFVCSGVSIALRILKKS
jgi:hypothetical protein